VGTVLLPAACALMHFPAIGWAKPVPVNPYRMRSPRADMAAVAFSGPLSNILLAMAAAVAFKILVSFNFLGADLSLTLLRMLSFAIIINLALAMFNLIPLFPLDGSNIMLGVLKGRWLEVYEKHMPYGMYIILGLVITGQMGRLILPPLNLIGRLLAYAGVYIGI